MEQQLWRSKRLYQQDVATEKRTRLCQFMCVALVLYGYTQCVGRMTIRGRFCSDELAATGALPSWMGPRRAPCLTWLCPPVLLGCNLRGVAPPPENVPSLVRLMPTNHWAAVVEGWRPPRAIAWPNDSILPTVRSFFNGRPKTQACKNKGARLCLLWVLGQSVFPCAQCVKQ